MSEWPLIKLGDVIELITGFPFKSKEYSENGEGYKLLRGDNIVQGRFRWEDVKLWPKSKIIDKHENYWLKEGDVILAMDRPWIEAGLKYAQITRADLPCLLVQRTSCLRAKVGFDQNFLRYLVSSYYFVEYVKQVQTGTAVPHISGKQILDFEFNLPPIEVQNEIGNLLRSLDNKIELNRQVNQTLEQIAQAIFKSWFVDFESVKAKIEAKQNGQDPERAAMRAISGKTDEELDQLSPEQRQQLTTTAALFPDELEDSELGEMPKGWGVSEISEMADVVDCLHAKKPEIVEENTGNIFLQLKNISDDGLLSLDEIFYISDQDYKKWISRIEAKEGDCVITNVGRVGAVAQIPRSVKAALGRNMTAIRCKEDSYYPTYLITLLTSSYLKREIELRTDVGTILNALNVKNIPKLRFVNPGSTILKEFEVYIHPLQQKREINIEENRTLGVTRDTLLPKLLSGEITPYDTKNESVEAVA